MQQIVLTGAPCSGKSTYIRTHAGLEDVIVDFDDLCHAISPASPHWDYPHHIQEIARELIQKVKVASTVTVGRVPHAALPPPAPEQATAAPTTGGAVYEFEPEEGEILADLLPRNLAVQIFRVLLENAASFYGSQMTAMDNATKNAGDMIKRLTLQMNRTRQATITKELIEIISGAEAV